MVVGVSRVTDLPSVNGTCAKVATDDDDDDDDGDDDVDDDDADGDDDDDDGGRLQLRRIWLRQTSATSPSQETRLVHVCVKIDI